MCWLKYSSKYQSVVCIVCNWAICFQPPLSSWKKNKKTHENNKSNQNEMPFCVCFGSWFTSNTSECENKQKCERSTEEVALYLCLLYIYVISSMYKEVIIKRGRVARKTERANERMCALVFRCCTSENTIYLSWNRWCCISHKIHYYLPCECNKIRFDVNNKMVRGVAPHTDSFSLSLCSRSLQRFSRKMREHSGLNSSNGPGPRFISHFHRENPLRPPASTHINSIYSIRDVFCINLRQKQKYLFHNNNTIIFYDHQTITLPFLMTHQRNMSRPTEHPGEGDDDL